MTTTASNLTEIQREIHVEVVCAELSWVNHPVSCGYDWKSYRAAVQFFQFSSVRLLRSRTVFLCCPAYAIMHAHALISSSVTFQARALAALLIGIPSFTHKSDYKVTIR